MRNTVKATLIVLTLLIPSSIALNNNLIKTSSPLSYFDVTITSLDEPQYYLLSSEKQFTSLEIIDHEYQKNYSTPPATTFHIQNNIHSNNNISIIYNTPLNYDLLKKGKLDLLRIFIPSTYYKDNYKYTTTSITLRIHTQNNPTSPRTQKVNEKVGTIIENKGLLTTFDFSPSSYDPENPDYEYVIITNETLWSTFNSNFKDWKINSDDKINNILIVNVSDIIDGRGYTVNDSYGDSTNESMGNHWIPDGKEITSNWELFNDTQAQIRNFLRECYDDENTRYVLLGGNKNLVPPRMASSRASGDGCSSYDNDMSYASDMYYACLHYCMNNNTNSYWMENPCCSYEFDEVDIGFDLCVGRVPVDTVEELNYWINKTKNYFIGGTQGNFLRNQICAAKNGGNAITDDTWYDKGGEYSASIERQVKPISNLTFLNSKNITQAQWSVMYDYCNGTISGFDGINMILMAGHGGFHSGRLWDYYQPDYCGNSLNPNFVYTESCNVGGFGTTTATCIEDWISDDGCMVAGICNSAYGWFGASTFFVEEFLEEVFNETLGNYTYTLCQAHNDGRENEGYYLYDGVWAMIYKETNFFGDPALEYQWYTQTAPQFIDINGQGNQTTIHSHTIIFNWTSITNTSQYQLEISNSSDFDSPFINITNINSVNYPTYYSTDITNITFILPPEYVPTDYKTYYCRVRSYNGGL